MQILVKGNCHERYLGYIQYDPEQDDYIYSSWMSAEKKAELTVQLQSFETTLEEAISKYFEYAMQQENRAQCPNHAQK